MQYVLEQLAWNELTSAFFNLDSATGSQLTDLSVLGLIEPTDDNDVRYTILGLQVLNVLASPLRQETAPLRQAFRQARALRISYDRGLRIEIYVCYLSQAFRQELSQATI